jgi:hypothetical protein
MSSATPRGIAYADLVGGLLDARVDPATQRFDAQLAEALEAGTVTGEVARALRFWQRAAVRGVVDHARRVLPPALEALDAAREESHDDAAADQRSWAAVPPAAAASSPFLPNMPPTPPEGPPQQEHQAEIIDLTVSGTDPDAEARLSAVDPDDRGSRLIVAGLTEVPARTDTPS